MAPRLSRVARDVTAELPPWTSVLAVVAHPDDESFGLGAVLAAFGAVARVSVLCFTHGEASTLHGVEGDLRQLRGHELRAAAHELGLDAVTLLDHPDGALEAVPVQQLVEEVAERARATAADGLVVFDPSGVTGHPDHRAATAAALEAAARLDLPVLGWTLPAGVAMTLNAETGASFTGHPPEEVDVVVPVDRTRQRAAIACHPSQALPTSVLWRRLELLGDEEHLRLLR
jgi:LmbE family N-acetylglucosaminyl deacetylase